MNSHIKVVIFLAVILFSEFVRGEQLLSKSVFVQLADPITHEFLKNEFSYFPAGTKLIKGDKEHYYKGSRRILVYGENGILAYVTEGMFWTEDQAKSLIKEGGNKWVFIIRSKDIVTPLSEKVKLVMGFSRGEKYPLIEEDEDTFTIKVGKRKLAELGNDINYQVPIPRENAKLVDLSKNLSKNEAAIFKLSVIDGVAGIKKPCNTKTAKASKYNGRVTGEAGFSLKKFWLSLKAKGELSAEMETSKIEEFSENENVSREYYTRENQTGVYKLTRYKACESNQDYRFIYTNKNIDEITISKDWASELLKDTRTGQVLITCPQQYFKFFDELIGWNFEPEEIPFIISSTAKFKGLTSSDCQKS